MAQFILYRNNHKQTQKRYPFLLDIQNDFLDTLKTRLVIPVSELTEQRPINRLNPIFEWHSLRYVLITQEMATIPEQNLGSAVTELHYLRSELLAAVDLLITGI
jgi:toxin CcdB